MGDLISTVFVPLTAGFCDPAAGAAVGAATAADGEAATCTGVDLNTFWSGSRFTWSFSSLVSIFTSFNPDWEIKSIRSLISLVFISAWFGLPVCAKAEADLKNAFFLLFAMATKVYFTRSTYSPVLVFILILSPVLI